jgi:2'-5' RNA ligase
VTVKELNALVEEAYAAGLAFEDELTRAYLVAFDRAALDAEKAFRAQTVTAAGFVAPPIDSLTTGMSEEEGRQTDEIRNRAAEAIAAVLIGLGLAAVAASFLELIAARGSANFSAELMLVMRNAVERGLREGWTADETALAIRDSFAGVDFVTAQMLAQTELTTLVNERSLQAAQKNAEGGKPAYKVWQTMQDPKVRPAHAHVQGQTVPITQPFNVSGYQMMYPGDPAAPMRLVARCRCRMSYTDTLVSAGGVGPPPNIGYIPFAGSPDVSDMAMVAVYPRALEQRTISSEGEFERLHCTLIFLGEANALDMGMVNEIVAMVAESWQPIEGTVGGIGFFAAGEDGHPLLALPDVKGLSGLRETVATELAAAGIESPSEHGWMPHMTLSYVDVPGVPDTALLGESLHFDYLSVVVSDERTDYRLGGVAAMSAEEDTLMSMTETEDLTAAVTITITDGEEAAGAEGAAEAPPLMWKALLAIEGQPTEDGRIIDVGALSWRDLPLSLMAMDKTGPGGHEGAQVAGAIEQIERDGADIWGSGVFDSGEFGQEVGRMVGEQTLRGNSVDLAVLAYEYRNADTGEVLTDDELMDAFFGEDIPILFAVTEGVIMASTVCPTPAIAGAEIMLASGVMTMTFSFMQESGEVLTAAGAGMAPLHPPTDWFANPELEHPTPLTVTPEGRVYGHAALWNSCHIGEPSGPGICVPPPRSGMQYEIFHHGVVTTDDGTDIPCGQITMSTFHAGRDLGWKAALEHYENSGCVVADVVAGEDNDGIWISGGLRPDLPAERVREMKAGALSGDWRQVIDRGLEFLAALVVNIPGFPIPRPEARIVASAAGEEEVLALVAAGVVTDEDVEGMSRREYLRKIAPLTRDEAL